MPLSTILQEINTKGDPSTTLQQFAQYLDTISQVVSVMPMFVTGSSDIAAYSPEVLTWNRRLINQLIEGTEYLRQFVQTPIIESSIQLTSAKTKIDFFQTGVTFKDLGIDHMNQTQLLKYLHEGL